MKTISELILLQGIGKTPQLLAGGCLASMWGPLAVRRRGRIGRYYSGITITHNQQEKH